MTASYTNQLRLVKERHSLWHSMCVWVKIDPPGDGRFSLWFHSPGDPLYSPTAPSFDVVADLESLPISRNTFARQATNSLLFLRLPPDKRRQRLIFDPQPCLLVKAPGAPKSEAPKAKAKVKKSMFRTGELGGSQRHLLKTRVVGGW